MTASEFLQEMYDTEKTTDMYHPSNTFLCDLLEKYARDRDTDLSRTVDLKEKALDRMLDHANELEKDNVRLREALGEIKQECVTPSTFDFTPFAYVLILKVEKALQSTDTKGESES